MKLAKNIERLGTESAFKILAEAQKLEAEGKKGADINEAEGHKQAKILQRFKN